MKGKNQAVLVVGGGIAGVQASLDLAKLGYKVYLAEKSPALGGLTSKLYRTYPICFCCKIPPLLAEVERHPDIEVLTLSELMDLTGEEGNFTAILRRYPRYINEQRCTACSICSQVCPVEIMDAQRGLRKAAFRPDPQSIPATYLIDEQNCLNLKGEACDICQKNCPEQAIEFAGKSKEVSLKIGSIILSTGFEPLDAQLIEMYGYGELPNVVTSIEFERLLSPFGPSNGVLKRPSDGKTPKKIAWLQCVGSREIKRAWVGYCSGVCCMHAVKEALNTREKTDSQVETAIFFIDLRAFGRHFERYVEKAREAGVRFVRARIWGLKEAKDSQDIPVTYVTEDGKRINETFDMAVLSVGLKPARDIVDLAKKLSLEVNHYDFIETAPFSPTRTSKPGIYVCGAIEEPKDIYGSMVQASAAATEISAQLDPIKREFGEVVPLRDVGGEPPKVAVFICRCGESTEETIDTEALRAYTAGLLGVVHAQVVDVGCHYEHKQSLIDTIRAGDFNRIIFAGCSSRTNEPLFSEIVRDAGLSPYLSEQVNLGELCGFVHRGRKEEVIQKAKDLVRIAVAKMVNAQPLDPYLVDVQKSALIVGGGLSGLVAADHLIRMGFEAHILEKGEHLGGSARYIGSTLKGENVGAYLEDLKSRLMDNELVHIHTKGELLELKGVCGNFSSRIKVNGKEKVINHGAVIVAAGGEELRPQEYLYGLDSRVLTLLEFEERIGELVSPFMEIKNIVMIQCMGSREPERPYCSRICCTKAVKNAIKIKDVRPNINVYILYRDLRTYGFREDLYREAREKGVVFIRFGLDSKPKVETYRTEDMDILRVKVLDKLLGEPISIETDLVVLAAAVIAPQENHKLSEILRVPLDDDGFFRQSPKKLRPVETDRAGIFICGLANGPKFVEDSIAEAQASVTKAAHILIQSQLELWPTVSMVDLNNCDGCGYCIDPCPYQALRLFEYMYEGQVKKIAEVNEVLCQGCGVCQATCPKKGIGVRNYVPDQLEAMVEAAVT